jgi:hypothetical protein
MIENNIKIPSEAQIKKKKCLLYRDIWNAILHDLWMWIVCWGQPRTGKTTIQLRCGFEVYQDWDRVLEAIVFNLNGILSRMKKGRPTTITTLNGLHHRVPLILPDDFGAQCNKAKTQHEPEWDIFKGAFDTLGTKVAVLLASMGNPSGATQQIQEKYTHELYVHTRGFAKYDKVLWQQNYGGWQARQDKTWMQEFKFKPIPMDIYKQYDENRLSLVDELFIQIDDSMIENEGLRVFRRLNDKDVELIEEFVQQGQIQRNWFVKEENYKFREVLKRCRARNIVEPTRRKTSYWYVLTDFGFNIYNLIQLKKREGVFAPHVHPAQEESKLETQS